MGASKLWKQKKLPELMGELPGKWGGFQTLEATKKASRPDGGASRKMGGASRIWKQIKKLPEKASRSDVGLPGKWWGQTLEAKKASDSGTRWSLTTKSAAGKPHYPFLSTVW